jgi:hypothetical protein
VLETHGALGCMSEQHGAQGAHTAEAQQLLCRQATTKHNSKVRDAVTNQPVLPTGCTWAICWVTPQQAAHLQTGHALACDSST